MKLTNSLLASSIFGFVACLPLASSAEQSLQARFEKSINDARSITNVQIEWLDTLRISDPEFLKTASIQEKEFSRTFQYSLIASGQKFRAACKLISGTGTNLSRFFETAFDGHVFVTYWDDNRSMTRHSAKEPGSSSESASNPLVAPFMFLTKYSDDCNKCVLRFGDLASDEFAKGFTLPTAHASGGSLEFSFPGLALWKQPTTWTIAIDQSGNAFTPKTIKCLAPGLHSETLHRFLQYTNLGPYQFPSRIESTTTLYPATSPPTVHSTGTITLISGRIPDHIPDSTFRLEAEEKAAAQVWDWDQRKFITSADEHSRSNASTNARPTIYDESADASKEIAVALDAALKEHKLVLLQFGANWCGWCHKLHALFQTNQRIAEKLANDYVVVMVDVNNGHNKETDAKYGHPTQFGLPALVLVASDGRQLTTQDTGKLEQGDHHSPEKVMEFLEKWSPTK
jgi:thiol-disulfide isomerase/thioredoxin